MNRKTPFYENETITGFILTPGYRYDKSMAV